MRRHISQFAVLRLAIAATGERVLALRRYAPDEADRLIDHGRVDNAPATGRERNASARICALYTATAAGWRTTLRIRRRVHRKRLCVGVYVDSPTPDRQQQRQRQRTVPPTCPPADRTAPHLLPPSEPERTVDVQRAVMQGPLEGHVLDSSISRQRSAGSQRRDYVVHRSRFSNVTPAPSAPGIARQRTPPRAPTTRQRK